MVDVVATLSGYYGGARRDPGERFTLPDSVWRDEKRRPKWVRLAKAGEKVPPQPAERKAPAKPAEPAKPAGNGVQEALGGPAPDWLAPELLTSSPPGG
jgi:hypothetical protein